ncbi:MAG TPA: hypothetical protein VGO71_13780 [Baekduia sp.]|nr:hypothetical protein [Baekduia sp.]
MSLRALPAVLLACGLSAAASPAAHAAFATPTELAHGAYQLVLDTAADAAGNVTVAVAGSDGGPRLLTRGPGEPWAPALPLAGGARRVGDPSVAAAGEGALAMAWRVDTPKKYTGIAVALRDPRGVLAAPVLVADAAAGGVRHPAVAVDPSGGAVVAYNTGTRASHLSLRGQIAVALRPAGGSFGRPVTLDAELTTQPVVALAADGRGIVTWARQRRIYAASLDVVARRVGAVKEIAQAAPVRSLVAAAGPDGEATVAWASRHATGTADGYRSTSWVGVARRVAGARGFAATVKLGRGSDSTMDVALAADEAGMATVAWAPVRYPVDPRTGRAGGDPTTTTLRATAAPGKPFGAPRVLLPRGDVQCVTPTVAAAAGRVALAWTCRRHGGHMDVQAAVGGPSTSTPQTIVGGESGTNPMDAAFQPQVRAALDARGTATLVLVRVEPGSPGGVSFDRTILATSGS